MLIGARFLAFSVCVLFLATFGVGTASAQLGSLELFPGSGQSIVDGGLGDADGVINDQIQILPGSPVTIPGSNGLTFYGDVIFSSTPASGTSGLTQSATITVTNAALTNPTANQMGYAFDLARRGHNGYTAGPVVSTAEIVGVIRTTDGTTHGSSSQNLAVQAFDDDVDYPGTFAVPPYGTNSPPNDAPLAGWVNPGISIPPLGSGGAPINAMDSVAGTASGGAGMLYLRISDLFLDGQEEYFLPNSIHASTAVPEPTSLALLAMGSWALLGRRHRAGAR